MKCVRDVTDFGWMDGCNADMENLRKDGVDEVCELNIGPEIK